MDNNSIPRETWINPKIEIRNSKLGGKGMFAIEDIKKGEKVVIWGGKWGKDYVDKQGAQKARAEGKHIMQWDDDLFDVEIPGDSPGYFINHSCDPNIWMTDAFTLVARRNIKRGNEITTDYALMEADEEFVMKWKCRCGLPNCRKTITGKDWRLKKLQEAYKGHFSPLLNKRIRDSINL